MSAKSLPKGALLKTASLQRQDWVNKMPLMKWTTGVAKLEFTVPGDSEPLRIQEKVSRLACGAYKVAFAVENWPLVLKVVPKRGMNKHGWMETNDPLHCRS